MQINFSMKAGETSDFFSFLQWMYNFDEYRSQLDEYGIKPNEEYEVFMDKLRKDVKLSEEKLKLYWGENFRLSDAFITNPDIWKYLEIDKCLSFIRQIDKDMLKFRLIRALIRAERYGEDMEKIEEQSRVIASDKGKSLELIKSLEIDSSLKWELFCFLEEPEKYRDEYLSIMEEMLPIFHKHYEAIRKNIEEFSKYIEANLRENKIDFLKEVNIGLFKDEIYEKLFVSISYISYYSLRSSIIGDTSYVYIGLGVEDSIRQFRGEEENKFNKYINIFKNFSDPTRFKILKLLVEDKEYCNKDIAEELRITGATVSYHMDNLLTAELVTLDRKDRKNYYTVNKDVIVDGIEFIKRELKL